MLGFLVLWAGLSAGLAPLKWPVMDLWARLAPARPQQDGPLTIVVIDQSALDAYRRLGYGYSWPWRRDVTAQCIRYIHDAGARAIVLDVEFPDRHPADDPDAPILEQTDTALLDEVAKAGNVVCAIRLANRDRVDAESERRMDALHQRYGLAKIHSIPSPMQYNDAEFPFEVRMPDGGMRSLDRVAWRMGNVAEKGGAGGIFRGLRMVVGDGRGLFPGLAAATLLGLEKAPAIVAGAGGEYRIGRYRMRADDEGYVLLRFYGGSDVGPDGRGRTFRYVSMGEIMRRSNQAVLKGGRPPYSDPDLTGKIVLVGASVAGLYDTKTTPVSSGCPGVELHATLIANVLNGDLARLARSGPYALALLVTAITAIVVIRVYRPAVTGPATLGMLVLTGLIAWGAYARWSVLLDVIPAWLGCSLAFAAGTTYNYLNEGRRRRQIKSMFQTYVPPEVVDQMIANPELYKLGGERKEMSVFFSDIRGFTGLSEGLEPTDVVALLNIYLTAMTDIIMRHGGTLDKYIGDAIVAIYGAPLPMQHHAAAACAAALEMQACIGQQVNPELQKRRLPAVRVGMGIHSGLICAGNIGSERRRDYTVIGDGVNLASRLEGLNKYYATGILISADTRSQLGPDFACRLVDRVTVKGRSRAVEIHEVLGKAPLSDDDRRWVAAYEEGLRLSWARQWDEALARLDAALAVRPDDGPSLLMKKRVEGYRASPPPADWDGAYVMDAK